MSWTVIVPLKQGADRKSRLSGHLSAEQRGVLNDRMAAHVLSVAAGAPSVTRIIGLSAVRSTVAGVDWVADLGRGLNAELQATVPTGRPFLILQGDLPLLMVDDVEAMIEAALTSGVAMAPDRHGSGTNAVAAARFETLRFAFGPGSFEAHSLGIRPPPAVVRRPGLAVDVDTPDDLRVAIEAGFDFPADHA